MRKVNSLIALSLATVTLSPLVLPTTASAKITYLPSTIRHHTWY